MTPGYRSLSRLVVNGDILANKNQAFQTVNDLSLEVTDSEASDDVPTSILDALGKLTLYRLQERAQEALESGDITEATRRLENLATRLLAMGEEELANQTLAEARRVAHTSGFSDKGRKTIKYQTRFLLSGPEAQNGKEAGDDE
jgi:Ca-activated chloride channel family protein